MNPKLMQEYPYLFPLFFATMWLFATTAIGVFSGWYRLMRLYPDHPESATLRLSRQSGSLGRASLNGILRLEVCPSGLRVGIFRLFGPFCRDFFVPWAQIAVTLHEGWLTRTVALHFQDAGRLTPSPPPPRVDSRMRRKAIGRPRASFRKSLTLSQRAESSCSGLPRQRRRQCSLPSLRG